MVMHFFRKSIFREAFFPIAFYVYWMERAVALFYRNQNFLAVSQSTKEEIDDMGIRYKQMFIVEPGVDTEYFHPTEAKANPPIISYVGRLMKYKNAQFIIAAMPRLRELIPGIQLKIAGNGDFRTKLEQMVDELGVKDSVQFLGYISEEEKRDLLSRSTLFINPSFKEGWGINNIEANLCGTISVSNNVAGLKDSVVNGVTGILYENDDPEGFCQKVAAIIQDKERLAKLEENARQRALGMSWDAMTDKMQKAVEACLK
jgi:glycosyltransferase involved in cell wall biosynthesis